MSSIKSSVGDAGRMPTATKSDKSAINAYLEYMCSVANVAVDNLVESTVSGKSSQSVGQIRYFRQQVATLKWLISVNQQRKACDAHS